MDSHTGTAPPPPPPPPHGGRSKIPDGNYDIFIIPPHSSGSGFLYLPSLQPHRNSFLAGVACTLLAVGMWTLALPVLKGWIAAVMAGGGGLGVAVLVIAVGVAAWAWGKTQAEGTGGSFSGGSGGTGANSQQQHHQNQQFPGGQKYQPEAESHSTPPPPPPPPQPEPPPQPKARPTPSAASGWEKAREETKRREEERKRAEDLKKKREEAQQARDEAERLAKAQAEKERWEQARAREKEQREREARERIARERLAREKEQREKDARDHEAREKAEKEKVEKAKSAAASGRTSPSKTPTASSKKYERPTAKSTAGTEEAHSYRPYDRPKTATFKSSASSISGLSETSYAPSQSTARTTPPPSHRGPYSTTDQNKIQIKGVYLFTDTFPNKPVAQLVSNQGSVTDGLILRIQSEGLFVDDDIRNVKEREWDVKAWTIKLVEDGMVRNAVGKGLHVFRVSTRDIANKRYTFVLDEGEAFKVAVGLKNLKGGSLSRALHMSGIKEAEVKGLLMGLGWM